ncbi:hypothetical protein chiPu_0024659 [Chiloscyllium punctatum]|uniref:CCHC-type domain-containing protein n=1 Tax=Chiloscyllium punctatum TaxID=137246 RepID=A0A401TEC1_CHIPU|nr:hypothetical protein [Chiloscyllium punctatum]
MSLDNQAPATVAALSIPGPLVCYRCRQTGHYKFNCPLSLQRPGDPDLAGTAWVSTGAVPHRGMPTIGAPRTPANEEPPSREPTATHGRKNPTNPAALGRSLPPPSPDWDQLSRGQLLELLQLLARRKD